MDTPQEDPEIQSQLSHLLLKVDYLTDSKKLVPTDTLEVNAKEK